MWATGEGEWNGLVGRGHMFAKEKGNMKMCKMMSPEEAPANLTGVVITPMDYRRSSLAGFCLEI